MIEIAERSNWLGQWEIIIRDREGRLIGRTGLVPNLLTDDGLNMMRDVLKGAVTDGKVKYAVLGNSATAPAYGNYQLGAEQFRKAVTSQTNGASAGQLITDCYVGPTEANSFKTEEIGWFAGAAATGTVNTGILVARVLYSRQKSAEESWTIRRIDSFLR